MLAITKQHVRLFGSLTLAVAILGTAGAALAAPVSGAIFTTEAACAGTNINIFGSKDAVYLDGGPTHPGAAGLPSGNYYVKVTTPSGTLLGSSVGTLTVTTGNLPCTQLSAFLVKASDSTPGYDDTSNAGGEYKVWASMDPAFAPSASKTDNFKVKTDAPIHANPTLTVEKFYDANANATYDAGDTLINGWEIDIQAGWLYRFTPVSEVLAPGIYAVTEFDALEPNWVHTTATSVTIDLTSASSGDAKFGNLCLGGGGGLTLGFWSNKNGQKLENPSRLAALTALNLRNASGANFDPATPAQLNTWILGASATNMAYMLSAQLAAMDMNVLTGGVNGSALISAPGTTSANPQGFAVVNAIIAEANASLGASPITLSGNPERAHQEALKNALDKANNNLNFVQPTACPFSF